MRIVVLLMVSVLSSNAGAQPRAADTTVFGQVLDEELALPECEKKVHSWQGSNSKPTYGVVGSHREPCWQTHVPYAGYPETLNPDGEITLVFPRSARPLVMGTDRATLRLHKGRVIAVEVDTGGVDRQDIVAQALLEKYGKPHRLNRTTVRNRAGVAFPISQAAWSFSTFEVVFDPVRNTLDDGRLLIRTATAIRLDSEQAASDKAAKKKL